MACAGGADREKGETVAGGTNIVVMNDAIVCVSHSGRFRDSDSDEMDSGY